MRKISVNTIGLLGASLLSREEMKQISGGAFASCSCAGPADVAGSFIVGVPDGSTDAQARAICNNTDGRGDKCEANVL